jgi:hypothetical protein
LNKSDRKKFDEGSLTSHSAYIYMMEDSKKARKKLEPVVCLRIDVYLCVCILAYDVYLHVP